MSSAAGYFSSNTVLLPVPVKVWISLNFSSNALAVNVDVLLTLSNFIDRSKVLAFVFPITAIAVAAFDKLVPTPPTNFTIGAEIYPVPLLVNTIRLTFPLEINALADAPVPPPPSNTTSGTVLYPDPTLEIWMSITEYL